MQLTQSDIQILSNLVRERLDELEFSKYILRLQVPMYFSKCDPSNPDTLPYFKEFNSMQNMRRKFKEKANKLMVLQTKLKRIRNEG